MLTQLYIENIAVIEKANIDFQQGFSVLTGETGAGKSIIIDSINAILGGRTSRELVRNNANKAIISASFSNINESTLKILTDSGYELEDDGTLLLQRELRSDGKTSCRINGRPATVSLLRDIGHGLISIHGQHENYELLSPDLHVQYIDDFAELKSLLEEYQIEYRKFREVEKKIDSLQIDESQKARRVDMLEYQIQELENAELKPGEQNKLLAQRNLYRNSEKIATSVLAAQQVLEGGEDDSLSSSGAVSSVQSAADFMEQASEYSDEFSTLAQRIRNIAYDLEDCSIELRNYSSQLAYEPKQLEEIENRLDVIYRLEQKYGSNETEMIEFLQKCYQELENIQSSDETIKRLSKEKQELEKVTKELAGKLSIKRQNASAQLSKQVCQELQFLDMPGVTFTIEQKHAKLSATGIDNIQFLISTNPGEPPKPLSKIASGGELSRIMLAIKTVLTKQDPIDTLIFDEIDTGISGSAAQKVGLKLKQAALNKQVLCVTHLAQIAAIANNHFLIHKSVHDNRTYTSVRNLNFEERKKEIARIMAGTEVTPLLLKNAEEMLLAGKCS